MRFLSVCSGIEAASVAWGPLGWKAVGFSEIDRFACSVLAHHYPDVPNHGDMTKFKEWPDATFDVLCGGTPCQSFSVAGLREGLDDPRGDLMLTFGAIAARYRPLWLVWENVPGVLSSNGGRDFASFLGLLTGQSIEPPADGWSNSGIVPGIPDAYGLAWRSFDAQYAGLAQRRDRVFVVAHLGDWHRAAAVLFERQSLRGDPAPSRSEGQDIAPTITGGARERGGQSTDDIPQTVATIDASFGRLQGASGQDANHGHSHLIAGTLTGQRGRRPNEGIKDGAYAIAGTLNAGMGRRSIEDPERGLLIAFGGNDTRGPIDVATAVRAKGGTGHGDFESETFIAFEANATRVSTGDNQAPTMRGMNSANGNQNGGGHLAIAFNARQDPIPGPIPGPIDTDGSTQAVMVPQTMQVRRLTPLECERLQGFKDGYTRIPSKHYKVQRITKQRPEDRWEQDATGWWLMAADGPRYKSLGNSWAIPCVRWIGERIEAVEKELA